MSNSIEAMTLSDLQAERDLAADLVRDIIAKIPGTPERKLSEEAIGNLGIAISALEKTIERLDKDISALKAQTPTT